MIAAMATSDPAQQLAAIVTGLERAGLSRAEIAAAAHVSRTTVWRAANLEIRNPSFATYQALDGLCRERGVDVPRGGRR